MLPQEGAATGTTDEEEKKTGLLDVVVIGGEGEIVGGIVNNELTVYLCFDLCFLRSFVCSVFSPVVPFASSIYRKKMAHQLLIACNSKLFFHFCDDEDVCVHYYI